METSAVSSIRPAQLRCEYRENPLGIDVMQPRLSWLPESKRPDERGQSQSAYRILVASSREVLDSHRGDLWDTGRVDSSKTSQIPYAGRPLASRTQCYWKVRVWDQEERWSDWSETAHWTTGLLNEGDWAAQWIRYAGPAPEAVDLRTDDLTFKGSSWIWFPGEGGAFNAPPGIRRFRWVFSVPPGRSVKRARFLLTAEDQFTLFVNGEKAGESDGYGNAWRRPQILDITKALVPKPNCFAIEARHLTTGKAGVAGTCRIDFENGGTQTFFVNRDWKAADHEEAGWREAGFDDKSWQNAEEIAEMGAPPWGVPGERKLKLPVSPYLRKSFILDRTVEQAFVYVSALGLYELHVNGRRVGEDRFTPGWTNYNKRVHYNCYNITSLLLNGENAIGAILADGWYSGYLGFSGARECYASSPKLLVQLHIQYEDGGERVITSNGSWKASFGPILEADIQMGESYDARKELGDWSLPGYNDSDWQPVEEIAGEVPRVTAYPGVPVRAMEEIGPTAISEPAPGVYVFDLGQNMVGTVRLKVKGERGTRVVLRFGEMLNPDGSLYTINLRAARAADAYILKGDGEETWEPKFTFHGFRYVEVTGYPGEPSLESIRGIVLYSALPPAGWFECSNPMVNQLFRNIVWGQKGNYLEVPTDCPQRDERLGWTGDAQVFIRTATYNMDVTAFFTKWLVDLDETQSEEGAYTDVAPAKGPGGDSPAWTDAAIICPYTIHRVYGDSRVIERFYESMARYISFLKERSEGLVRPAVGYGDWLSLNADTPKEVISTAYFAYVTGLMAEMSRAIGRVQEAESYEKLFDDIRAAFNKAFVAADARIRGNTQTAYVLALYMDLLPEEKRQPALRHLIQDLHYRAWHISTGFLGLPLLLPVLTRYGRCDVAYRILQNEDFPSWGYQIKYGATTMWERWDGWTEEFGYADPNMNSYNHYAYGAVGQWLFSTVAGIETEGPGFRRVSIRPCPGGGLTHARASYQSIHGKILSEWRLEPDATRFTVEVPPNVQATVYIPCAGPESVLESDRPAGEADGVALLRIENGVAVFRVVSGRYKFISRGELSGEWIRGHHTEGRLRGLFPKPAPVPDAP